MTTPDKLKKPCPRNHLNDAGEIVTSWVEATPVKSFNEIEKAFEVLSSNKKSSFDDINEFNKELGKSIDHHLQKDTDEDRTVVKQLIDFSLQCKLNVYLGTQIYSILREEPKLISDAENIPHFTKYRQKLLEFNKEKKLVTTIEERFSV